MTKSIALQVGHWNIQSNCDVSLRPSTGAPLEVETNKRIAIRLEQLLQQNGFKTYLSDANYNCKPEASTTDFDLYLALHCDQNYGGDEGGGFVDIPDPSTDQANKESARIAQAIESVYFKESGIRNVPSRRNNNTKYYYMWKVLSAKTPCVIIEMGESVDAHDRVILNDTERVAKAILGGINKAFPGVVAPEPPSDPCASLRDEVDNLKRTLGLTEQDNKTKQAMIDDLKNNLSASNSKLKPLEERNKKLETFVQGIKELISKV